MTKKKSTKADTIAELLSKAASRREKNRHWIEKTRQALLTGDVDLAEKIKAMMVKDLQRVYEIQKDVIGQTSGRDTYRAHGNYSEQIVKLIFGTHAKFQRDAGLAPSNHERRVLANIAKTADAQEIAAYADRHVRAYHGAYQGVDVTQEMIVAMTCSDLHSRWCRPFARRVWFDVMGMVDPEIVDINGDLVDYPSISRHRQLPGAFTMTAGTETRWGKEFLAECRQTAQDASITFRLGNHDIRLVTALAERLPQLFDLDTFEYNKLFGLDENEIGLCSRATFLNPSAKLKKADVAQNWSTLYGPDGKPLYTWTHGWLHGKNAARDHMVRFGTNGTNGHLHSRVEVAGGSMATGVTHWQQTGCMAYPRGVAASYVPGPVEALGWSSTFLITKIFPKYHHVETQQVMIGDDMATFDGYIWEITDEERDMDIAMLEV